MKTSESEPASDLYLREALLALECPYRVAYMTAAEMDSLAGAWVLLFQNIVIMVTPNIDTIRRVYCDKRNYWLIARLFQKKMEDRTCAS